MYLCAHYVLMSLPEYNDIELKVEWLHQAFGSHPFYILAGKITSHGGSTMDGHLMDYPTEMSLKVIYHMAVMSTNWVRKHIISPNSKAEYLATLKQEHLVIKFNSTIVLTFLTPKLGKIRDKKCFPQTLLCEGIIKYKNLIYFLMSLC